MVVLGAGRDGAGWRNPGWRARSAGAGCLEPLGVEHDAVGFLEAERFVCALGAFVLEFGVGGEFGEALGAGPGFGGADEFGADAAAAVVGVDIPALDVGDG